MAILSNIIYGQSFFHNSTSAWNGLAIDIAEANTKLQIRLRQCISEHVRQRILLINEPEPELNV